MSGGFSHIKNPEVPVNAMTIPRAMGGDPPFLEQIFDLGQIRAVYFEVTLLSFDADGEIINSGVPGEYYWDVNMYQSRDGIDFGSDFVGNVLGTGQYDDDTVPTPVVVKAVSGITPRYLSTIINLIDGSGAPYAGPNNPTANWSIYVEYV